MAAPTSKLRILYDSRIYALYPIYKLVGVILDMIYNWRGIEKEVAMYRR
jgi:hypothetical protein